MQLFTVTITDLATFDSPPCQEWLETEGVPKYMQRLARAVRREMPDLLHRGMCVAMYDSGGNAISIVPLDKVQ